jgi:uncharacterized Zn finger protein (UPF0148 family)
MACLEHQCPECGFHDFSNTPYVVCPMCASNKITNWNDEAGDFPNIDGKDNTDESEKVPLFI